MMKRIALALVILFGISAVGLAAVENIKISGDITAQAVARDLSLGLTGNAKDSESFFLSQVRLRFDADLTENVAAVVQLINERLWGEESDNSSKTDIDLDLAYVVMKNFLYDPLTLTVGRQNLKFGRGLIVGDPDTDNAVATDTGLSGIADDLSLRKSFDAIRATLDFSPLVVDLVFARVRENNTNEDDNVDLYGVNANYQLSDKTTVEGYFFAKDNDQVSTSGDTNNDVYTIGLRGETSVLSDDKLQLYGEYAYQFGEREVTAHGGDSHDSVHAWALQLGADYLFKNSYNAKLGICYTYLSGDDDANDNDYEAWNPMFEDQRVGEIANILFDNSNVQGIKVSGSLQPREDITLAADYYYLRLAEKLSGSTYTPTSLVASNKYAINSDKKELGSELDVSVAYDYTEDVQLKLIGGWFFPGDFFDGSNDNTAYSLRASLKVEF
ncbi:MAG: alginate export family protein [Candidatus Omnitrophica bacterium]|nr:alginate export family protein [Candidatus Omnitrophota bacterium]